jgi:alcohol dehydrogenase (cytochrome c)
MKRWSTRLTAFSAVALFGASSAAFAVDGDSLRNADKDPNNWLTYHGSYKAWHYSDLSQINAANVKNMRVAWLHTPRDGLQNPPASAVGSETFAT